MFTKYCAVLFKGVVQLKIFLKSNRKPFSSTAVRHNLRVQHKSSKYGTTHAKRIVAMHYLPLYGHAILYCIVFQLYSDQHWRSTATCTAALGLLNLNCNTRGFCLAPSNNMFYMNVLRTHINIMLVWALMRNIKWN